MSSKPETLHVTPTSIKWPRRNVSRPMTRTVLAFQLLALSICGCAQAQDAFSGFDPDQSDHLSAAYARCAAYFTFAWKGLERSGKNDLAKVHQDFANSALSTSRDLAASSRSPEMALKVAGARYSLYMESMHNDIGKDFANISVIVNKYGKSCTFAIASPSDFSREYLQARPAGKQ